MIKKKNNNNEISLLKEIYIKIALFQEISSKSHIIDLKYFGE